MRKSRPELDLKDLTFRKAQKTDWDLVSGLVNSVFRTKTSDRQWTTEVSLVGGTRLTEKEFLLNLEESDCTILLMILKDVLLGCVRLHRAENFEGHLGMLSIHADYQNFGLGRVLIGYAENFAKHSFASKVIVLHVIAQRPELIEWYLRLGYEDTGKSEKFQENPEWDVFHLKPDLYFKLLKKNI